MNKDIIYRQAAIDAADRADYTGLAVEDVKKVTDEVVKELKQLPSAQPEKRTEERTETHSCDCISRQAAINALTSHIMPHNNEDGTVTIGVLSKSSIKNILNKLPSAQPERKTGRWIPQKDKWGDYVTTVDGYVCSECNNFDCMEENYCPNCGARMMEGEG